jgi:hypothetical protein
VRLARRHWTRVGTRAETQKSTAGNTSRSAAPQILAPLGRRTRDSRTLLAAQSSDRSKGAATTFTGEANFAFGGTGVRRAG